MTPTSGMAPAQPGEVLLGKYRVEGSLGSGGMGVVLRATHLQLGQPVALKFLVIQGGAPPDTVANDRFLREARATFRLKGENSVRVLDVGTSPNGTPFIVMEMLEGKDLRQLLNERGFVPAWEAVGYILQVCSSLEEAHAYGIVHRDLKPRNLFLTNRIDGSPCVKVLDFGISKVAGDNEDNPLTNPQMALGSPRYMAPEQWMSSATVDARADIYATAMVLYELLTGKVALAGLQLGELIRRLSAGAIPSPRDLRPDLPEPLCKVILKAMRPHPDERFPSIQAFAAALREVQPPKPDAKSKMSLAATAATAVVDREVMLARAALTSRLGPPVEAPPSTVTAPITAPLANVAPPDDEFELKTTVGAPPALEGVVDPHRPLGNATLHSAGSRPFNSTLPIQQAPQEILAMARQQAQAPAAWPQPSSGYAPQPMTGQAPPQQAAAPQASAYLQQPTTAPMATGPVPMRASFAEVPPQAPITGQMPSVPYAQRPSLPEHSPSITGVPIMSSLPAAPPPSLAAPVTEEPRSKMPWLIVAFVLITLTAVGVTVAVLMRAR